MRRFAGIEPELVECFVERVELVGAGSVGAALDRWKELQAQGWDVTALGADDGSHLIGLGCRYLDLPAVALSSRA